MTAWRSLTQRKNGPTDNRGHSPNQLATASDITAPLGQRLAPTARAPPATASRSLTQRKNSPTDNRGHSPNQLATASDITAPLRQRLAARHGHRPQPPGAA